MEFFFGDHSRVQQPVSNLFLAASRGNKESVAQLIAIEDPQTVVNGLNSLHIACKVGCIATCYICCGGGLWLI